MIVECKAYQHEGNMMFYTLKTNDEVSDEKEQFNLTVRLLSNVECDQPVREFLDAAFIKRYSWIGTQ